MRPLEQYATLRKGRAILMQRGEEEWRERTKQLKVLLPKLVYWAGIRLMKWGYWLEHYA